MPSQPAAPSCAPPRASCCSTSRAAAPPPARCSESQQNPTNSWVHVVLSQLCRCSICCTADKIATSWSKFASTAYARRWVCSRCSRVKYGRYGMCCAGLSKAVVTSTGGAGRRRSAEAGSPDQARPRRRDVQVDPPAGQTNIAVAASCSLFGAVSISQSHHSRLFLVMFPIWRAAQGSTGTRMRCPPGVCRR